MTSRVSGSSPYSQSDVEEEHQRSRDSDAQGSRGSRSFPSASWYAESLDSFRSARQARSEQAGEADDDSHSLHSYVSYLFSEPSEIDSFRSARQARSEKAGEADDDSHSLHSYVSYLFSEPSEIGEGVFAPPSERDTSGQADDTQSYASLQSNRSERYDATSTRSHTSDRATLWGVARSEYEAVQRDEGMPSLENESTTSRTASILSDATFVSARSRFSNASGSSSKKSGRSNRSGKTLGATGTASVLASESSSTSSGSDQTRSGSSNRLRSFARLRLSDEVASLISPPSNSSRRTPSHRSTDSTDSKNSTRNASVASNRSRQTNRSTESAASILSNAQASTRWIPPRSRAPNLPSIEDSIEGEEASRLESTLGRLRSEAADRRRQRFVAQANDVASRLRDEMSYQDRRTLILSARIQRENALPSVSSGSSRSTDSDVVARLRAETSNSITPSQGPAIERGWAGLDDITRYKR